MTESAVDAYVLAAYDLVAGYGEVEILHSVSVAVGAGNIVSIIGPNGAGKSTVLKCILGLLQPVRGSVEFRGDDVTHMPTHKIVRRGLAYVPQGRIVFSAMSVRENLEMGAFARRAGPEVQSSFDQVYDLFPALFQYRNRQAGALSGGQQQMLAIGRAMMLAPSVIILDEPSLGLAPKHVDSVFEALTHMRELGYSMLMVEQNAQRALEVSDYGYVLDLGKNRLDGIASDLLANSDVREMYLGG